MTPACGVMHGEPGCTHRLASASRECHPDKARGTRSGIPRQPGQFLPRDSNGGHATGHLPCPVLLERFRQIGQIRAAVQIRGPRLLNELTRVQDICIVDSAR